MTTPLAATRTATTTMSSVVVEFDDLEEAETLDVGSSGSATVVDSVALEPGDTVVVVDGGLVTMADAPALAVVDVGTVALVTALVVVVLAFVVVVGFTVVVGLTVVVVGFTVVVVGFTVVVVGFTVVVVADTWHPGVPWPAFGLHVLPGWALAGPAYTQAANPIATASAHVMPNATSNERKCLFLILKPPLSHTAAPFGRGRYLSSGRGVYTEAS